MASFGAKRPFHLHFGGGIFSYVVASAKGIAINHTQKFGRASGFKCCAIT